MDPEVFDDMSKYYDKLKKVGRMACINIQKLLLRADYQSTISPDTAI